MKKYKVYGLMPMTKHQIIEYMKSGNELTKTKGGYLLTGGTPFYDKKGELKYKKEFYRNYEHYFKKLLNEGIITEAYAVF